MLHDAGDNHDHEAHASWSGHHSARDEEHDQVGTVEVQILLSWFFESSPPDDLTHDLPHAA